jgi:hypothetical protein
VNLYGVGGINNANLDYVLLFQQQMTTFSTPNSIPQIALQTIPGFAYGIALDIERQWIYAVGQAINRGRLLWRFDFDLSLKQTLFDGSTRPFDAFYFVSVHPSGNVYLGGELWESGQQQVGILKYNYGSQTLPQQTIDRVTFGQSGYAAQFNTNNYALYIAGKSSLSPLLYKYEG